MSANLPQIQATTGFSLKERKVSAPPDETIGQVNDHLRDHSAPLVRAAILPGPVTDPLRTRSRPTPLPARDDQEVRLRPTPLEAIGCSLPIYFLTDLRLSDTWRLIVAAQASACLAEAQLQWAKILWIPRIDMSLDVDQVGKSPVAKRL
jgi:hypothetical protein